MFKLYEKKLPRFNSLLSRYISLRIRFVTLDTRYFWFLTRYLLAPEFSMNNCSKVGSNTANIFNIFFVSYEAGDSKYFLFFVNLEIDWIFSIWSYLQESENSSMK